ncbi:uncharacterized protein BXZ73DRAFT_45769 [Epithele typhae]|uniref:uncharacterized protein n=1 Tax=Epithele typhae TaxID=378194 RepID=UPI002007E3A4|nr:uncharacterized protein BXZ73DRAFT_45769 [Epithele typhae]KAH9934451.1 hypothetical protein BXZ73DRAFT_45769 [Epithele typhae]
MRRLVLNAVFLLCFLSCAVVKGEIVKDNDPGMVYSGFWLADGSPNALGNHETWTNQSGASVYYDFTGTQVKVYATRRPVGTYMTLVSFTIDDDQPMMWDTTDPVEQETFNTLVYTSNTLPAGQHRIEMQNLGSIFWLVYLDVTTSDITPLPINPPSSSTTTTSSSTTSQSTTSTSTSTAIPTKPASVSSTSSQSLSSPTFPSSVSSTMSASPTSSDSSQVTIAEGSTDGTSQSPSSPTVTAQSNVNTSPPTRLASRTPLIVGIVAGLLGVISLLAAFFLYYRMRRTKAHPSDRLESPPPEPERKPSSAEASFGKSSYSSFHQRISRACQAADAHGSLHASVHVQPPTKDAPPLAPPARPYDTRASSPSESDHGPHYPSGTSSNVSRTQYLSYAPVATSAPPPSPHARPLPSRPSPVPDVPPPPFSPTTPLGNARPFGGVSAYTTVDDKSAYMVRRARDGGVRVAGGTPDGSESGWVSSEWDDAAGGREAENETLPPRYRRYEEIAETCGGQS